MKEKYKKNILWLIILLVCIGLVVYIQFNLQNRANDYKQTENTSNEAEKVVVKTKEEFEKDFNEEKTISPYSIFEENGKEIQAVKYLEEKFLVSSSDFKEKLKSEKLLKDIVVKDFKIVKKDKKTLINYKIEKNDKEYYVGNDVLLINESTDESINNLDNIVLKRKLNKDLDFSITFENSEFDFNKSKYKIYKPIYKAMSTNEILGYIEIKKGE